MQKKGESLRGFLFFDLICGGMLHAQRHIGSYVCSKIQANDTEKAKMTDKTPKIPKNMTEKNKKYDK